MRPYITFTIDFCWFQVAENKADYFKESWELIVHKTPRNGWVVKASTIVLVPLASSDIDITDNQLSLRSSLVKCTCSLFRLSSFAFLGKLLFIRFYQFVGGWIVVCLEKLTVAWGEHSVNIRNYYLLIKKLTAVI